VKLVLHNYWRSSSSHRVRIGLALKGLAYEYVAVNLLQREQLADAYRAHNPLGRVPTLEITEDDGTVRTLLQSVAILEYLEERWPAPPLLPADPYLRARTRALVEIINSGIQPFQNLATTKVVKKLGGDPTAWSRDFITEGLAGFAQVARDVAGPFCVGDTPTLADVCLVPQLASARRVEVDLTQSPLLTAIEARCLALPAFVSAAPDRQPDAVK